MSAISLPFKYAHFNPSNSIYFILKYTLERLIITKCHHILLEIGSYNLYKSQFVLLFLIDKHTQKLIKLNLLNLNYNKITLDIFSTGQFCFDNLIRL